MPELSLLIKPASGLCNMSCQYCFYADVAKNREVASYGIMSEECQRLMVRRALAYAEGSCSFVFQGGEPTLAGLEFYRRQIELEHRYNFHDVRIFNSIQTNGYNLDEEFVKFLAANHFFVGLSLDGPKEIHDALRRDSANRGTYDRVMETVRLFEHYGVDYNILTVVSRTVAENAKKVYSFFREKKFRYLQFIECLDPFEQTVSDYSLSSADLEKFLKITFDEYYKDFKDGNYIGIRSFENYLSILLGRPPESCGMCGVCTAYQLIEAGGNVYPCDFYVLDRYLMGNVMTNTFAELAASEVARRFVDESRPISDACRKCEWYRLCRGGCRRNREPFVDGLPSLNRFCEAYKGFFEYAYPRMVLMAKSISAGKH